MEPDKPTVRYLTLTELLHRPASDPDVEEAKSQLSEYGPTQTILAQFDQFKNDNRSRAYQKYGGRYWQLIFLGQLHADGQDPRIREIAEKTIEAGDWVLIPQGGQCLTANLLNGLHLLGYGEHPVVQEATVSLAERLVTDGGIACEVMDYSLLPFCYMAQPKLLLCFSASAELRRHPSVAAAIELLSTNLIAHQIFVYTPGNRAEWQAVLERKPAKSELGGKTVKSWMRDQKDQFLAQKGLGELGEKSGWQKFGFPLHYNSDLLEAMYALARCDIPFSDSLRRPLSIIRAKMTADGKWLMENSLNGKMRADIEQVRKPSKWLTYRGWYVLQHFGACQGL